MATKPTSQHGARVLPISMAGHSPSSIYHRPWSMWNLASWTMKQLGVADMLKRDTLPSGQFVVISTVEEAGQAFTSTTSSLQSLFERCFSKAHFHRTFNAQLLPDKQLSETDMEVLLRFLSRDKHAILYDGTTIKINPPTPESPEITPEDTSVAQLKELLFSLTHQTSLLSSRIDLLTAQAKQAIGKQNRPAALAALRSKKLAEATLERRFATVNQLEEVAAKIEAAADNVQLVRVMEVSEEALERLTGRVGGVDRVEEVMGILREQMDDVDEVGRILAEGGGEVVDEAEVDEELGAMEVEERRKVEEIERAKREERERVEAEKMQERLEGIGEAPGAGPVKERSEGEREREVEDLMSRMSLRENP
ncbi:hypothetical protein N0V88_004984 [Collariella sp. IMI 366227]|nr:hypothetical protein N0V88_004984 [Collariella sp. IMI 366227]